MKRADPPPPTSLEGQFLIAMPSLRDGPFARSVVYLCAHREDGAMGIIINQRADEIEFAELLVQLDIVPGGDGDSPAAARRGGARCCAAVRSRRAAASFCIPSDYGATNSTVKIADDVCLTATIDILRAIANGRRPGAGGARPRLRGLGFGPARERDPGQRLADLPGRCRISSSIRITSSKYDRALAKLGVQAGCCRPTPATPEACGLTPVSADTSNICARPSRSAKAARIGAGQEHLAAESLQRVEQGGAPARIEMRGDLVEERERRDAGHVGDQPRVREHEADQQRLLLAGRGAAPPARPWARAGRRGRRDEGRSACGRRPRRGRDCRAAARGSGPRRRAPGGSRPAPRPRPRAPAAPRERASRRRVRRRSAPRAGSRIRAAPRRSRRRVRPPRARSRRARRRCARPPRAAGCARAARARTGRPARRVPGRSPARSGRGIAAARSPARRTARPSPGSARRPAHGREKARDDETGARSMRLRRSAPASPSAGLQPEPSCASSPSSSTSIESANPPPPPRRAHSASSARRRPRPGDEQRQRLEEVGLAGAILAA